MSQNEGSTTADLQRPTAPIDRLIRPFQVFARNKLAGAILLLGATAVALVWANSPWAAHYTALLKLTVTAGAGSFIVSKPLLLWINDGLMGVFFFVVGLEIKRELLAGELSTLRKATLPIAAAVGGMVVPALVYFRAQPRAVRGSTAGASPWPRTSPSPWASWRCWATACRPG